MREQSVSSFSPWHHTYQNKTLIVASRCTSLKPKTNYAAHSKIGIFPKVTAYKKFEKKRFSRATEKVNGKGIFIWMN